MLNAFKIITNIVSKKMLVFIIMPKKKVVKKKKKVVKKKKYSDKIYKSSYIPFLSLDYDEKRYVEDMELEFLERKKGMAFIVFMTFMVNFIIGYLMSPSIKKRNFSVLLEFLYNPNGYGKFTGINEEILVKEYKKKRNINENKLGTKINEKLKTILEVEMEINANLEDGSQMNTAMNLISGGFRRVFSMFNMKNTNCVKLLVDYKLLKIVPSAPVGKRVLISNGAGGWNNYHDDKNQYNELMDEYVKNTSIFKGNSFGLSKYFNVDKNPEWVSKRRKELFLRRILHILPLLGIIISIPVAISLYYVVMDFSRHILEIKLLLLYKPLKQEMDEELRKKESEERKKRQEDSKQYAQQEQDNNEGLSGQQSGGVDFGRKRKKRKVKKRKKRKVKKRKKRKVKKIPASLKKKCKRLKIRLTLKKGGKRVYKSETMLKKQCSNKSKKK